MLICNAVPMGLYLFIYCTYYLKYRPDGTQIAIFSQALQPVMPEVSSSVNG